MTLFLRLLSDSNKFASLAGVARSYRSGETDHRIITADPSMFLNLPGASFAYWVRDAARRAFEALPEFESDRTGLLAKRGVNSNDDFRFIRLWWEIPFQNTRWVNHPKGGKFSPFYSEISLVIDWHPDGRHLEAERVTDRVYAHAIVPSRELYFRPGLTWPLRTKSRLSMRIMPRGCVFGSKGPAVIAKGDDSKSLLATLAICSSKVFYTFIEVQLAAADAKPGGAAHSFEVGVIQRTPIPVIPDDVRTTLANLARIAWERRRTLDTVEETSHAFLLPPTLRSRLGDYNPAAIEADLARILIEVDSIAFDLYGFTEADRQDAPSAAETAYIDDIADDEEDEDDEIEVPSSDALLSWAVGVAFGRFDWRLATGERQAPSNPGPFDPLPIRSAGMLSDGAEPFHAYSGILVDDQGHTHDLAHLVEEVLGRVNTTVPDNVRRWLNRNFFAFHLQRYSKSRRKAPIYWPLATSSSSYTLWVYYPSLSSQTLYTAINNFVEPKAMQVGSDVTALRNKGAARSREDEKQFEIVQAFELELIEFRDALLELASTYKPSRDDGVQISAAPLLPLFRHKPWQKVLKDTWGKLEKGDYDWAHLAMNYWPERVREKCKTDKSLAVAHGLEELFIEEEVEGKTSRRGRKK